MGHTTTIDLINGRLFSRELHLGWNHEDVPFVTALELFLLCWNSWPRDHCGIFESIAFHVPSRHCVLVSDSVIQHCDLGCIEVQTSDYVAHDICERLYIKIPPDADGMYRLTIFSGYPLGQAQHRRSMPSYKQDYVWEEDYYRVSLDVNNCLRVARECFSSRTNGFIFQVS